MKKTAAFVLTLGILLQSLPPAHAATLTVPAGTAVIVKLNDTVSSATHKQGDTIALHVVSDIHIGPKTVIAAGAPVKGTVKSAAKRFIAGIGGEIEISVDQVTAVDGTLIALKFSTETHNGSTLMAAVIGLICCCCAWLIPGKDVSIEKDSLFDAVTVSATDVTVH